MRSIPQPCSNTPKRPPSPPAGALQDEPTTPDEDTIAFSEEAQSLADAYESGTAENSAAVSGPVAVDADRQFESLESVGEPRPSQAGASPSTPTPLSKKTAPKLPAT